VVGFYLPDHEYREKYYSNGMKKKGHEVKLVTSNVYYKFSDIKGLQRKRIMDKIKLLDEDFVIRKKALFYFEDKVFFRIDDIIKKFDPDIIHTFEATQYQPLIVAKLAEKYKIPLIYEHEQRTFGKSFLAKIDSYITPIILREVVKIARGIRALTPEALDFIKKYIGIIGKEISISTLGYNPEIFFYDLKIRNKKRSELGIKEREILVVISGKNLKEKRTDLIIRALSSLQNVKVITIGPKKFRGAYKSFPLLDPKELNKMYNAADLCVWTRYTVSYFQALGTGCDILVPKTKYTLYLSKMIPAKIHTFQIESIENQYLYKMKEEEIIKSIRKGFENFLILNKKNNENNSRTIYSQIAREKFAWDQIINGLEKFYYKIYRKYR